MKLGKRYGLLSSIVLMVMSAGQAQTVDSTAHSAMTFNGTTTYGYIENSGAIETRFNAAFTIECWFKTDYSGQTMTIAAKTDAQRVDYHFLLGLENGKLRFVRGVNELQSETSIQSGVWYNATAVYKSDFMSLYLNGQLEGTTHAPQTVHDGYNTVEVGARPISSGRTEYWNGSLEELKLWGEGRSAGEVLLGTNRISLVGQGIPKTYYQFNQFFGASGNEIHDAYGEKILIVQDGALVSSDCPVGPTHGYWSNQSTSVQEFYTTGVFMQFSANTNNPVAVNAMIDTPNTWSGIANENQILDDRYWLVDWVGNPQSPTISFHSNDPLPSVLSFLPGNAQLFRRDLNSQGNWTLVGSATDADLVANTVTFTISQPGQYAVMIDDDSSGITTQLRTSDCNRPATTFSNTLTANNLSSADQYEFVVYNVADGFYDTLKTNVRNFKLKHLQQPVRYDRTYTVKVRGIWSGAAGPFGDECTVTTIPFPTTQLQPQFWWNTVNMKQRIKCENIAGATEYIFNVSNSLLGFEEEYVSDVPNFKLKYMQGPLNYSDSYDIKVRSVMMGDTSAYGPVKTVYTDVRQTNKLRDGYCDTTDIRKSTWLKAETVHFVDEYQFRVINVDHGVNGIYTTSDKRFKLREVEGTTNCGLVYAVNVRTIMNGDTTAWGDTCFVTTENLGCRLASPDAQDGDGSDISQANAARETEGPVILGAYPNPFNRSVQLNFEIEETQQVYVEVYDTYGRMLREFPARSFNPGSHSLTWDGTNSRGNDCQTGTYIMVLRNDRNFVVQSIRLMLKR